MTYGLITFKKRNQLDFILLFLTYASFFIDALLWSDISFKYYDNASFDSNYLFISTAGNIYLNNGDVRNVFSSSLLVAFILSIIFFLIFLYLKRKHKVENNDDLTATTNSKDITKTKKFSPFLLTILILIFLDALSQNILFNYYFTIRIISLLFFFGFLIIGLFMLFKYKKLGKLDFASIYILIFISFFDWLNPAIFSLFEEKIDTCVMPENLERIIALPFFASYHEDYNWCYTGEAYVIFFSTIAFIIILGMFIYDVIKRNNDNKKPKLN